MYKIILILLISSSSAYACKCSVWTIKPLDEKVEYILSNRENVFLIKITNSMSIGKSENDTTTLHDFELLENFKGNFENKHFPFLLSGSAAPNSCTDDGIFTGQIYLVYTNRKEIFDCSILGLDLKHEGHMKLLNKVRELSAKYNHELKKDAYNNSHF